jgi:coproporphyrinogen III oxidase-like Fe-S oxidoreductase
MSGLYIHIPFCSSKCIYCDFYSTNTIHYIDAYVDALLQEMVIQKEYLADDQIEDDLFWRRHAFFTVRKTAY